jgi:hypothetical protein
VVTGWATYTALDIVLKPPLALAAAVLYLHLRAVERSEPAPRFSLA